MELHPKLLAISSFRLLGSSEPQNPLSQFGGGGRAGEKRPWGREWGDESGKGLGFFFLIFLQTQLMYSLEPGHLLLGRVINLIL